jgi:hypothetical protein
MKTLVTKMSKMGVLKLELVLGMIIMAAAIIVLPVSVFCVLDITTALNPFVLGVVFIGMLMFGSMGYFSFVRPYILYRKFPEVQAETDGEFLYIHANKEAKIPLADLRDVFVYVDLPFMFSEDASKWLIIFFLSEKFGDIDLEIPNYGKYKLRFVANVQQTADELIGFIENAAQEADAEKNR